MVAGLCIVLAAGTCTAVLAMHAETGSSKNNGQPVGVVPHLVPDVGGLHAGSQSPAAAPHAAVSPEIRLIPSAGGPVNAYGGASANGANSLPTKEKR